MSGRAARAKLGGMSDVTRRDAFLALASGAVLATGREATAAATPDASAHLETARQIAARSGAPLPRGETTSAAFATVHLCRSWDQSVYLRVDARVRGFATVNAGALAIAAACQAAGRPVAVRYWGSEPEWMQVGRFAGVLLAVEASDLPPDPAREPAMGP